VYLSGLPSGNQTWQWKIRYQWRFEWGYHLQTVDFQLLCLTLRTPEGFQIDLTDFKPTKRDLKKKTVLKQAWAMGFYEHE
jgi:hypothetical protein